MNRLYRRTVMALVATGSFASMSVQADDQDAARERAGIERQRIEVEVTQANAAERARQNAEVARERAVVDVEREMRRAEARMAEAARRIAELSSRQLPGLSGTAGGMLLDGRPVLGVTLARPDGTGPVEGVEVQGVSPGGAAAESGLRAGDIITALNDESLSADDGNIAHQKIIEFMSAVEEGDVLDVEYLRGGKSGTLTLEPRPIDYQVFSFGEPGSSFVYPLSPGAPGAPSPPRVEFNRFVVMGDGQGFGDMEMVKVSEALGRYFGTDDGLLVVRAPQDDRFKLADGDVILDIDGRAPRSVAHAVRILGSYQGGESLKLRIMRDKREHTLDIDMPDTNGLALYDLQED